MNPSTTVTESEKQVWDGRFTWEELSRLLR